MNVYSIQWGKALKVLCNGKPIGQIVKRPDLQFEAVIGDVTALGPAPANALEKVVRKLDPMAVVHTL